MKKKLLLLMGIFSAGFLYSQIGINTDNPLALFHIDGKGNTTSITVGIEDDVVITATGNLGIGTVTPPNKVSVISTGSDTGLQLTNGAKAGNTLASDISGHTLWKEGKVQYQTVVYGSANSPINVNSLMPNFFKINTLGIVLVDKVKDIYGASYGWDNTNQQYIAPVTGTYRIAYQVYFQTRNNIGENYRAYLFRNGTQYLTSGIISVTNAGHDIAAFTMGIASFNKGDIIDLRIAAYPTGMLTYWSAVGDTYLIIEAL